MDVGMFNMIDCPIFQITDLPLAQFVGIGAEAGCRSARFPYVGLGIANSR
jgi:hypothetical protein